MIKTISTYWTADNKKIVTRKPVKLVVAVHQGSLYLILIFQTLFSWVFLQNTAFQDEATYIYAGRQIIQHWMGVPGLLDNYNLYFSGSPYVYPIIAGVLDMLGGLELVRAFSTLCMLIVTACGYYVTKQLFNQKSAIFAAIFFACQAPVLFLSRLATYDALCLCLLALATVLAIKASQTKGAWQMLGIGPLLVLAFDVKYAALLFIPSVLAILILYSYMRSGWRGVLASGAIAIVSVIIAGGIAIYLTLHFDHDMLQGLAFTTTNRVVKLVNSRIGLLENVLQMVGVCYLVAGVALFFVRKKELLMVLLLIGSSLLVPAYHIYKAELISLDKHLGFSMFFLMPVSGYALACLAGFRPKVFFPERYLLISSLSTCLILFLFLAPQSQVMYTSWPPTNELTNVLKTQIRKGNGHYLAEQFEVSRYNLENETYNWQWIGLDFFQYTDKQGHSYIGDQAYVKAIDDGYFDVVQVNYSGYYYTTAIAIAQAIARNHEYKLIDKVPYHDAYGLGYYWIWGKR